MNLEDDLRRAFRRTPAPTGFVDRVVAHIERREVTATDTRTSTPLRALPWLAAAAAVTVMAAHGALYHSDRQRLVEAERIQADIRFALQITSEKLTLVQRKVQDASR